MPRVFGVILLIGLMVSASETRPEAGDKALRITWEDNMLRVHSPLLKSGPVEIWYLEAFCRRGSTDREWAETVIPHKTRVTYESPDGGTLRLESMVEPGVVVEHHLATTKDSLEFQLKFRNPTDAMVDIEWAQPCVRVEGFTGLGQDEYIRKCFIFTERGCSRLNQTRRTEEARYRGGQVYVPKGINKADVNPRPLSPDVPVNGLIGCVSADESLLLAMAWDHTQELFQGVITCVHSDPRIGGLAPGESKEMRGRLYILPNDPEALLRRYRRDFGEG